MNYFTMNTYEMKRDILNFSNKMSNNLSKPTKKFVMDSLYGIAKRYGKKLIDYVDKLGDNFMLRVEDKRVFLFKGKKEH